MALTQSRVYHLVMNPSRLRTRILGWYDRNRRSLPWRASSGEIPDPYLVWLSEIMLQQTGTATVAPYYQRFTARWPTVHALANAGLDEVLTEWAGLGYYARARNLHACALIVSTEMNGEFPSDLRGLQKLPGIGPYTAAAITAKPRLLVCEWEKATTQASPRPSVP